MVITIKNIGIIKKTSVECNNITLITGKNGSGKSTFGKAVGSVFCGLINAQNEYDEYFYKYMRNQILEIMGIPTRPLSLLEFGHDYFSLPTLRRIVYGKITFVYNKENIFKLFNQLFDEISSYENKTNVANIQSVDNREIDRLFSEQNDNYVNESTSSILNKLRYKIDELYDLYDNQTFYQNYVSLAIRDKLNNAFSGQVKNIELKRKSSLIQIDNNTINLKFEFGDDGDVLSYSRNAQTKFVFYIEDADFIDNLFARDNKKESGSRAFQYYLKKELQKPLDKVLKLQMIEKYKEIFDAINSVYPYDFLTEEKSTITTNNGIDIKNEACGRKIFALIKEMMYRGLINNDSIIIFDEPDNHLHPEWQVKFIDLIVKINKLTGAKIICITHSPTILFATQVFTKDVADLKVYFCDTINKNDIFTDVSSNIEKAHKELADPYIKLDIFGSI